MGTWCTEGVKRSMAESQRREAYDMLQDSEIALYRENKSLKGKVAYWKSQARRFKRGLQMISELKGVKSKCANVMASKILQSR